MRHNISNHKLHQIDPGDELEFARAMQQYKQDSGRLYPTWSEVLEVLGRLGYRKEIHAPSPGRGRAGAGTGP